jgi:hypothetical protein
LIPPQPQHLQLTLPPQPPQQRPSIQPSQLRARLVSPLQLSPRLIPPLLLQPLLPPSLRFLAPLPLFLAPLPLFLVQPLRFPVLHLLHLQRLARSLLLLRSRTRLESRRFSKLS